MDKCYVNIMNAYPYCRRLGQLANSDHHIVQLLSGYKQKALHKPTKSTRRKFNQEGWNKLKHCFETTEWDCLVNEQDNINKQAEVFTSYVNFCTDLYIPEKQKLVYANNKPWISQRIINLVKLKHQAAKANNRKLYHRTKRQIGKEMLESKRLYTKRIEEQLAKQPASAWSDIKKLSGLSTKSSSTNSNSTLTAEELNNLFARFEKPSQTTKPHTKVDGNYNPIDSFTKENVESLMSNLNARKGPGTDGMLPLIIKTCSKELADVVTNIFNSSVSQRKTPDIWKTAIIQPLPKVHNPKQLKDYRPIAITSCLSKLLEKLIKRYIVENTKLDPLQFAYQAGRSTQDAVLMLLTEITSFIDRKASNYARCLFLDFSSAFNTINVTILIDKLTHLDPKIVGWVSDFLSNRMQFTIMNSCRSTRIITNTGTPQGTVLSPLLFSIYTSSIRSMTPLVSIFKYADDTVLVGKIAAPSDFDVYVQEINRVCDMCKQNDLILNASKTLEMVFTTQRKAPNLQPLRLESQEIPLRDTVKYLGVMIDCRLNFDNHVEAAITKSKQRLYIVRRFINLGAQQKVVNQLFKSFVESRLLYCLPVLHPSFKTQHKKQIKAIYKAAHRLGLKDISASLTNDNDALQEKSDNFKLALLHKENHPFHQYTSQLPSGRLKTLKHRTAAGKNSFLRQYILYVNSL